MFVSLLSALVVAGVGSGALPGAADRYVPARIAENIAVLAADATLQLLLGSALIVMAVTLGRYLGTDGLLGWLAMIAGVVGGAAFIAAGAIQQETVFYAVFVDSKQAGELATASGASDLTALNLAINVVAGGMRSVGSYAFRTGMDRLGCHRCAGGATSATVGRGGYRRWPRLCLDQLDRAARGTVCPLRFPDLALRPGDRSVSQVSGRLILIARPPDAKLGCTSWRKRSRLRPATSTPDSLLNVLVVHSEGEPCDEHGRTPLVGQVLAKQLKTDEDLTILLTAIAKHTSMYHQFFDAHMFPLIRGAAERPISTAA